MSLLKSKLPMRRGAALAIALAVSAAAHAPAHAGDDGAAPIWVGFGHTLGILKDENDTQIDYHEHGKLVLPPKLDLPPPGSLGAKANPAWPVDQEVQRARKEKKLAAKSNLDHTGRVFDPLVQPGVIVTMSATAGQGPGPAPCKTLDPKTGACPIKPGPVVNYNPLTWVGLAAKPKTVLGPEPDREELTDPPRGYRAPVQGVGALTD